MSDSKPVMTSDRERLITEASRGSQEFIPFPYHCYDMDLLYLLCRFDPDVVRQVMPAPFEPVDEALGVIMLLSVARGWVIAPFTACVTTLQVKGYDQPDKFPANFMHTAMYSGVCGEIFGKYMSDRARVGSATLRQDGDRVFGTAGLDGADTIRVSARMTDRVTGEMVGMNTYLHTMGNARQIGTTSYSARFRDLEDVSIEVLDTAPEPLRSLKPLEVMWSIRLEDYSMTFNQPRLLGDTSVSSIGEIGQAAVFDLLRRLGKPAALMTRAGRPLMVTPEAERLLGTGQAALLAGPRLGGRRTLSTGAARDTADWGGPVVIEHPPGRPLVMHLLPVMQGITDEPVVLALFSDPKAPGTRDTTMLLRLLGLTPAEARLAEMVGRGRSPQEAAPDLDITRHTARSMMKTIFDKLEVSRQSQLAQLVTRLETI